MWSRRRRLAAPDWLSPHENIAPVSQQKEVQASMSDPVYQVRTTGPVKGSIRPPGSKSITNRALVCAALAEGDSVLYGTLASDDTRVMLDCLAGLNVNVDASDDGTLVVHGCDGRIPSTRADLFVGNSGTTIRFLTAMVALGKGEYRLDGIPRMRERPIADLLEALRQLGAQADDTKGCPPVIVRGHGLAGGQVRMRGNISSQYLSGLLMAAPYAAHDVAIAIEGPLVSLPYVEMTCAVMQAFGVTSNRDSVGTFHVPAQRGYAGREYSIEPDASAASYFWAAAAITGGDVLVQGLTPDALQGDVRFCDCLQRMGCEVVPETDGIRVRGRSLSGIDVNMNQISDTVQTLAAVALFADGPTVIRDVAHIRHKETDRIGDLARELRKLGAYVEERADGMTIQPPEDLRPASIETYDDHRMAMSLALVGLRIPDLVVLNPGCTAKTYPNFFRDLERLSGIQQN